jgi:hypothetical protein
MKRPHALLVNPWICDFKAFDFWLRPLGLLTIASMLRDEGCDLTLLDCLDRRHWSLEGIAGTEKSIYGCGSYHSVEIEKPGIYRGIPRKYKRYGIPEKGFISDLERIRRPDIILVTTLMTYWYPGAVHAVNMLKEFFPSTPLLLGGIYARLCGSHAGKSCGADLTVSHANPEEILNIVSGITGAERIRHYSTFDREPMPAYHLLDRPGFIPYLTSLGCPYRCSYCASGVLFPEQCLKSPEKAAAELGTISRDFGVRDIAFYDDALLFRFEGHLGRILSLLERDGISFRFHTPNAMHGRCITESAARSLRRAGFTTIRLGLEFASQSFQQSTGSKVTGDEMEEAVCNLKRAGFKGRDIGLYVMTGVPSLSFDDVKAALEMCSCWGVQSRIVELSPFPAIPLWSSFPGSDTEEAEDPLFHNNTFHTYRSSTIPLEAWLELKNLSTSLNRAIQPRSVRPSEH